VSAPRPEHPSCTWRTWVAPALAPALAGGAAVWLVALLWAAAVAAGAVVHWLHALAGG
jgi:hypothetical protein